MEKQGFVYILANASRHIYIGSTTNLAGRLHQHRLKLIPGFTRDHNMTLLVWYEESPTIRDTVARERDIEGLAAGEEGGVDRSDESTVARPFGGVVGMTEGFAFAQRRTKVACGQEVPPASG